MGSDISTSIRTALQAARRKAVTTARLSKSLDAKCAEWDRFTFPGESPTGAAARRPGEWQLVYELRPLELILYWLGIPFRPYHPVYAVIYDVDGSAYYTAPASKVAELGRPGLVRGAIPLARLFNPL